MFNRKEVYIIAELSANHEQNYELAVKTIRAMKEAGADAVKLQTFTPDSMTLNSDKPWFQTRKDSLWVGQKLYDLFKKAFTPWEWHPKLQALANELDLDFFSSPFDIEAVEKLESINVPAYKVASLEITDIPLIERIAQTGKPVIISTGIAREDDIQLAIDTCLNAGNDKIALLKCTSAYPTPFEEVNLSTITLLQERFKTIVGLSDHTLGIAVPVAAVALGARIIEKHFILDKSIPSLDRDFSLDPDQFRQMVMAIRETEKALGKQTLELTDKQKSARNSARSLFAVRDIQKDEVLSKENIKSIRPGLGLHPKYYAEVIGQKAKVFIEAGTPLSLDLVDI
ncbi:MAG: pseudaminic acid synthase [Bacteroidales bacterium]|nr:pseudaminic acid synthase [Bacteroidales bacterium]